MTLKEERRVVTLWKILLSKDTAHRGYMKKPTEGQNVDGVSWENPGICLRMKK